MRALAAILFSLLVAEASAYAQALDASTQGRLSFPTVYYDNPGAVLGGQGTAQTGQGTLRLPSQGAGRLPLVVIVHTIGGWRESNEGRAARELNDAGFATFELDGFGPRNVRDTFTQGGSWITVTLASDAFHALAMLAAHPRIDASHAAIVGFSMGGEVAHLAAFEAFAKKLAAGGPIFAAHVPFYAPCAIAANPQGGRYTGAPVLMLLAERDDAGPPEKCGRILEAYRQAGRAVPVEVTVYEGAYHAWTNSEVGPVRFFPQAAAARTCPVFLSGPVAFLDGNGTRPFNAAEWRECLKSRGYSMGYDERIRRRSMQDLLAFLNRTMAAR